MAVENLITKDVPVYTGDQPNKIEQGNSAAFFAAIDSINAYLSTIAGHENEQKDQMNALAEEMNSMAESADQSAIIASTAALAINNFAGSWVNLTGPYVANIGVFHNDILWLSDVEFTDGSPIENSEPSDSNTDWIKVSGSSSVAVALSGLTAFSSGAISYLGRATLTDTETLYVYTDTSDGNKGKAVVVTRGATLSISNELTFDTAAVSNSCPCRLFDTQAGVVYTGADSDGYAVVLNWDGETLTAATATPYKWLDATTLAHFDCTAQSSSLITIFLANSSVSNYLHGITLAWNGTNLSIDTALVQIMANPAEDIEAEFISTSGSTYSFALTANRSGTGYLDLITFDGASFVLQDESSVGATSAHSSLCVVDENTIITKVREKVGSSANTYVTILQLRYYSGTPGDDLVLNGRIVLPSASFLDNSPRFTIAKTGANQVAAYDMAGQYFSRVIIVNAQAAATINDSTFEIVTETPVPILPTFNGNYVTLSESGQAGNFLLAYPNDDAADIGGVEIGVVS